MLHPTTAKKYEQAHVPQLSATYSFRQDISLQACATDWNAVTYQYRGHCNVAEISVNLSESKTDRLDT